MRSCTRDSDCRGGYVCADLALENPWAALVIDRSGDGRVCVLRPPPVPTGPGDVCTYVPAPGVAAAADAGADAR